MGRFRFHISHRPYFSSFSFRRKFVSVSWGFLWENFLFQFDPFLELSLKQLIPSTRRNFSTTFLRSFLWQLWYEESNKTRKFIINNEYVFTSIPQGTALNFLMIGFLLYLVYAVGAMGTIHADFTLNSTIEHWYYLFLFHSYM